MDLPSATTSKTGPARSPAAASPAGVEHRIVVGVDGSNASRHALRWGASYAAATGARLEAVLAWEPFTGSGWLGAGFSAMPEGWNPAADAELALATTIEDVFGTHPPTGLTLTVREGSPTKALIDVSRNALMLIVGSRGHGGFAGLLLGSVSAACAEHADCPVLVLHGDAPPPPFTDLAASTAVRTGTSAGIDSRLPTVVGAP